MKFQDLKLEKERERERNPRSKNDNVLSRERENLWHGGSMGAVLRERSTICVIGFAKMKWKKHGAKY